jgi:hypothetical protein
MAKKPADTSDDDGGNLRRREAAGKRKQRAEATVITIPKCGNKTRRKKLESDDIAWLMHYFGPKCGLDDPFTYEFTSQQREMILAIRHAIKFGGDQAIAASRGEGKTTLTERLVLKSVLAGEVNYVVTFAANGSLADGSIDTIRQALTENVFLAADYPEACVPIIELEGVPQRAKTQRANGVRHDNGKKFEMAELGYSWCGQELIFPKVPGSPSAGAIIATRGLDAAVRGLKKRGKRPKLAIIDDPDTEDTARSEEQAGKLEKRIDASIGGLGGQRRSISRVMLTTIQSRIAVSYKFTDSKQKPTFKGRRYRFLVQKPTNVALWDEYIALRTEDLQKRDENGIDLDQFGRRSNQFYLDRQEEMDLGAVVSNPNRFNDSILPDGSQEESSALQHYYNLIQGRGQEAVSTEYDNDPPEESAIVESGLSPTRIQRQVNGFERRVIPDGCTILTQGIDVRKVGLHWVVRAWTPDGTGHVIDYGVHEVVGTKYGVEEGVDVAVTKAILARMEATRATEFRTENGERLFVDLTLCDAGWQTDAVYSACLQVGVGMMPVMGFGKSSGCTQANFRDILNSTDEKKPGDGWFLKKQPRLWLVCADADRWKVWEHERWMTSPQNAGSLFMFGFQPENTDRMSDDQKSHHAYARHICNESEVEEPYKGIVRRRWKAKSDNTHWLDASYYCDVAANMRGVKIATASAAVPIAVKTKVKFSDMQKARR